ncbi:hypothetical protein COL516b_010645 [Colletotrichum fioriniae]|nr:uncharacterized protein COL516b_010645 [Colletotrichum fioriniae]KAJ0297592.1 hypothetical protein COL516b_010645 [Colletotrichum fioriniae]
MQFLAVFLFGVVFPACTRSENRFRRPPGPGPAGDFRDNPVYTLGDNIDLQWEMDLKNIDLIVWQQQPTGNIKGPYAKLAYSSPAQTPTTPTDKDQLSSTAVAGIAVGATLGALILLALLAGLVRKYIMRRRDMAVHTEGDILVYAERQLQAKDEAAAWKLELPAHSRERFEVEACEPRHEMPAEPVGVGLERG